MFEWGSCVVWVPSVRSILGAGSRVAYGLGWTVPTVLVFSGVRVQ